MNRKEFLKLLEFICSVGGINYYEDLLERLKNNSCNISDDEQFKELKGIASLFKTWVSEFEWSSEDVNYMNYVINISK